MLFFFVENQINRQTSPDRRPIYNTIEIQTDEVHSEPLITSSTELLSSSNNEDEFRETIATLTKQCAELEEVNRSWLAYQQRQLDQIRLQMQTVLPVPQDATVDEILQQIVENLQKSNNEKDSMYKRIQLLETLNNDLLAGNFSNQNLRFSFFYFYSLVESSTDIETIKESYTNTIRDLDQQLNLLHQENDHLKHEKDLLQQQVTQQTLNTSLSQQG